MTTYDVVTARTTDSDGVAGVGYTVMHARQGDPITVRCDGTFRPSVKQGFRSVKMRLGRPTIAEDIARVPSLRR